MRKLLQVGDRVIDLAAVVAAENTQECLTVYLAGVDQPFHFTSDEASTVWSALVSHAAPAGLADEPSDFQVIEMPLGDDVADSQLIA